MSIKVLFITTTNLSTNPRLLKEIKLAIDNGYSVDFIGFKLGGWSDNTDLLHLKSIANAGSIYLSATKKPLFKWLMSTIIWKICIKLSSVFKKSTIHNAYAHNKRTWLICNFLKRDKQEYDFIVAHNLGALYPAYQFSKKTKTPFAFDIEDYHPGEKCFDDEKLRREMIMKKLLLKASYLSYASPLIGLHSLKLLEGFKIPEHVLINNCFSQSEFNYNGEIQDRIDFVWFSQNISSGRGLELILPVLIKYKGKVCLHLIGNLYQDFYDKVLINYKDIIEIEKPLAQSGLNKAVCNYDIGFAIEISASDLNKDIALSNKIFTYAQAGLYIIATDTSAQKQFISENPQLGVIAGQSIDELEITIGSVIEDIENIRRQKKWRFDYAQKLAWENESKKLLELWENRINYPSKQLII